MYVETISTRIPRHLLYLNAAHSCCCFDCSTSIQDLQASSRYIYDATKGHFVDSQDNETSIRIRSEEDSHAVEESMPFRIADNRLEGPPSLSELIEDTVDQLSSAGKAEYANGTREITFGAALHDPLAKQRATSLETLECRFSKLNSAMDDRFDHVDGTVKSILSELQMMKKWHTVPKNKNPMEVRQHHDHSIGIDFGMIENTLERKHQNEQQVSQNPQWKSLDDLGRKKVTAHVQKQIQDTMQDNDTLIEILCTHFLEDMDFSHISLL